MSSIHRSHPLRPGRRRLRRAAATVLALLALVTVPAAHATAPAAATAPAGASGADDSAAAGLGDRLRELVAAPDGPAGALILLQDGSRTQVHRAGVADLASGRPPEPYDHMRLASMSKAYSGAVALRLVDQGALRLSDTLGALRPELPAAWHRVTLAQLLRHTSGLPDYTEAPRFRELLQADPRRRFDSRRLLDFVREEPLRFRPGSRYAYSNSDNIAVALMAEAATGRRYEQLLRAQVTGPLKLRHTSLPQGWWMPRPALHGYAPGDDGRPEDVTLALSMSGVWASGGIVSTPAEVNAFVRAYAGPGLVSEYTRGQQFRFVPGVSGPPGPGRNAAGLGIFRYTTRCGTVYGHTGNMPGYTQFTAATADGRRSVTVSVGAQLTPETAPARYAQLRAVQESAVCALLESRPRG